MITGFVSNTQVILSLRNTHIVFTMQGKANMGNESHGKQKRYVRLIKQFVLWMQID